MHTPPATLPAPILAAIAATDRDPEDRKLDAGRKPGEVLAFFKIAPGQKVAELFAGRGYTDRADRARRRRRWSCLRGEHQVKASISSCASRGLSGLAKPVMKNVIGLERPIDDPFPADLMLSTRSS